ncbi:ER membrane protein complex subunit 4 [Fusarium sp. Ph1]|nr:ER membrane protein complex subunit 4 [Fusarium sp. Ph1]
MSAQSSNAPAWVSQLEHPPAAKAKVAGVQDPPGFSSGAAVSHSKKQNKDAKVQPRKPPTAEEMDTLKLKKAWEVALAPVKGLPMTGFMMYMSGNSLQIFSIMMVFMAFKNPLMGLVNTNQALERFQTESNSAQMLQVKFVYVACQLLALAVGVWKINGMGLLPTTRSDWLMWEVQREPLEHAVAAL